jgi:hypothetical protein
VSRDFLQLKLEVVSKMKETVNVYFSKIVIYRSVFSNAFEMKSEKLMKTIGVQCMNHSRMIFSGEMKNYSLNEDDESNASGMLYVNTISSNLKEIVTEKCGVPVSNVFARKNYIVDSNNLNKGMTMNRDVILLNECGFENKIPNLFKSNDYKFYVICNINLQDEMKLANLEKPDGDYDSMLTKFENKNTVYAVYAVKV